MKNIKAFLKLIALCSLFPLSAQSVRASIDSSAAYVGQSVTFSIKISGSEKANRPVLKGFDKFTVTEAGESTSVSSSFVNGKGSRQVVTEYNWYLTPLVTGELNIPSVEVEMDGETLMTSSGVLKVIKPGRLDGYELFLTVESEKALPGMPVRLTLKWLFSSQVSSPEFTLPFLDNPDFAVKNVPAPSSQNNDIYQFVINGEKVYAMQSSEMYKGEQYASLTLHWDLYPEKSGRFHLSPILLAFKRATGRDGWGNYSHENTVIPSNDIYLDVETLPAELSGFPGGVLVSRGEMDVKVSLDQQKVYPGDPVSLKVEILNLSNPDFVNFRGFQQFQELANLFKVDQASLITSVDEETLTITQTIRAVSEDLKEFPALYFPYYNQQAGRVDTFISDPVSIEVLPFEKSGTNRSYTEILQNNSNADSPQEQLGLHHNASVLSIKPVPEISGILVYLLFGPVVLYILIIAFIRIYQRHSQTLMQKLSRRNNSSRLLEKELKELVKTPSIINLREFNSFLLHWFEREYEGLIKKDLTVDPELSMKYFNTLDTGDLERTLEKLNRLCWAGNEPKNLELSIKEITQTLSGKGRAVS